MRRLVVVLVAGVVLVLGLDAVVTEVAEDRVGERAASALGTPVEAELTGWPVALRTLVSGTVPHVWLRARDVPVNAGVLSRLDVALHDVELSLADLTAQDAPLPEAGEARFTAEIEEGALPGLLALPVESVEVSLRDGVASLRLAGVPVATAVIEAREGLVVVVPEGPAAALLGLETIPIDLSDETGSPYVDEVEVRGGMLVVRGRLAAIDSGLADAGRT